MHIDLVIFCVEENPRSSVSGKITSDMPGRNRPSRASALPLRARNYEISYREPSSEIASDDTSSRSSRRLGQRPSRKRCRVSYNEKSSGSDEVDDSDKEPRGAARQDNQQRAKQQASSSSKQVARASKLPHRTFPKKASTPTNTKSVRDAKKGVVAEYTKEVNYDTWQLGGKVPPWQTLPYDILFHIFQYASYPLTLSPIAPNQPSIAWLLKSALLCKEFAEPALSALYYAPPLYPPSKIHRLLMSLHNQHERSFLNYRAKIKYLDLEAARVLSLKYEGRPPIQLAELVAVTPQLRGIGIHLISNSHSFNLVPPIPSKRNYQSSLYPALDNNNIHLIHWIWNASIGPGSSPLSSSGLKGLHQTSAFRTLKSLTFVNSTYLGEVERFTDAASVLPNLKSLTMKNVEIKEVQYLRLLPTNLESLSLSSCQELESSVVASFLRSHGGNLRDLVLDHNNSLDLAFVLQLAISCPRLERLKMDLRFYNSHVAFRDSDPAFDTLLTKEMIPTWPRTLQRLELFHLRKWDTVAAGNFFSSFVDSAKDLPDLRYMDIKASIGESNWRDRISFRNKWTSRMEKVFKRVSAPPDPRLRSIPIFMKHRKQFRNPTATDVKQGLVTVKKELSFSHLEVQSHGSTNPSSDSDMPLVSRLRSTQARDVNAPQVPRRRIPRHARKRPQRKRNADEDSSTEEDSALEDLDINAGSQHIVGDDDDKDLYIQGMCDVVRVAIDNLRPTEEQLGESDFLDEEISGDEDWVGDDDAHGGGGGYAW
ncbi:MAG: hypothetical protein L6R40_004039 [Gallowayella cf. fulva]|nr:MAG: hypothetical protein L6R40_004039 [Xanthomendoza cf. fulva]